MAEHEPPIIEVVPEPDTPIIEEVVPEQPVTSDEDAVADEDKEDDATAPKLEIPASTLNHESTQEMIKRNKEKYRRKVQGIDDGEEAPDVSAGGEKPTLT